MEMIATGRNVSEGNPDPVSILAADVDLVSNPEPMWHGGAQQRRGKREWARRFGGRAEHGLGLKSTAVMELSEIDQRWMGVLSRT
ncbi:hypothetical protein M0R45_020247 [Rubus argutus]|uniref:Uncharacterized protein n=1 Tax=Rubus argutus TaxID=59490 RepID=A0AAW1X966_RUBAR